MRSTQLFGTQRFVGASRRTANRSGISLVEILIVISIISVLLGLLLVGISGARVKVREVSIRSDISQLAAAVNEFKSKNQITHLPSRIVLREDMLYGTHALPPVAALERESNAYLRRLWPRLQSAPIDWNQDGAITPGDAGSFILEGDQCLVFFLGGAQVNGTVIGFSTSVSNPMLPTGQRHPPFFEFKADRLQYVPHPQSGNAPFLSFMDGYREMPYIYFSTRSRNDYRYDCPSFNVLPYAEASLPSKFHSPDGFQIICAGSDRNFGAGGPWDAATGAPYVNIANSPGRDDFANFHNARLGSGR